MRALYPLFALTLVTFYFFAALCFIFGIIARGLWEIAKNMENMDE